MELVRCSIPTISLLLLFLLSTILESTSMPHYLAQYCPKSTFESKSKFKSNLKTLLNSLSSKANTNPFPAGGFYNTSITNTTTDGVYGLFLCRGDQNITGCGECVKKATTSGLPTNCPNSKMAVIYYDECMVRYSNESLYGIMVYDPYSSFINVERVNGNQTQFLIKMWNTMQELAAETANGGSLKKFATKMVNISSSVTLYVLQQCTPDLTPDNCGKCLNIAIGKLEIRKGGRVLMPSCNVRYESYPFYFGAVNYPTSAVNVTIPGEKGKNHHMTIVIVSILASVAIAALVVCVGSCICVRRKKAMIFKASKAEIEEEIKSVESLQFDLSTIRVATHNFSSDCKLGEGGFGEVYKGKLDNGQDIAVKRLSKDSGQGVVEFKTEVVLVAKLQHKNLVKLLGFCVESTEKILVYEFLVNSSLDLSLFDLVKKTCLDWQKRFKIIIGVAKGLLYLHEDSRLKIIHRDLKPSNILLDEHMNPKISDFGLAKHFGVEETQGDTKRIVGTYGYMAPEYAITGQYSVKSDVYSFGVIILEIVSGQRSRFFGRSRFEEALLHRAWRLWNENKALDLVDPTLSDNFSREEVLRCMHVGLLCVQGEPIDRPRMNNVVSALTGQSISIPMPKIPHFFGTDNIHDEDRELIITSPYIYSGTEMITDVHPRE